MTGNIEDEILRGMADWQLDYLERMMPASFGPDIEVERRRRLLNEMARDRIQFVMRGGRRSGKTYASQHDVPLSFYYPEEYATSAGAFGGHQPGGSGYQAPESGDNEPTQRVFDGELPDEYIDAGATGHELRITHSDLLQLDDLNDALRAFMSAARVHAPWLEMEWTDGNALLNDPIRIRYLRPCITSLRE